jgi:hypothetical protein
MHAWFIYGIACYAVAAFVLALGYRVALALWDAGDYRPSRLWTAMVFVAAPLWVPVMLGAWAYAVVSCLLSVWRESKRARGYREPQFVPVELDDLPDETFRRFQRHSSDFVALGMTPLGDYYNKPEPVAVFNRYFSGFEGAAFGDLTDLLDECTPGFFSVLSDGTYVESAGCADLFLAETPEAEDRVRVQCEPSNLKALCQRHIEAVRDEAQRRGVAVLAFDDEQLAEVAIYGQRKFYTWRRRVGEDVGEVPAPVAPSGRHIPVAKFAAMAAIPDGCAI